MSRTLMSFAINCNSPALSLDIVRWSLGFNQLRTLQSVNLTALFVFAELEMSHNGMLCSIS